MDFNLLLPIIAGIVCLISAIINQWRSKTHNHERNRKSPPEPSGAWPFIGHLLLLGGRKPVAQALGDLADRCGPIFVIRLGVHRVIVISSWETVKECLTHNDRTFASRPVSSQGKYLGYDHAGFGFASYGPYWRVLRKLVLTEVLSARRLEKLRHVRVSEIEASIRELHEIAVRSNREVVEISKWLEKLTLNIIIRMIAGKRYFDCRDELEDEEARNFRRVVKEFMHVSGDFVLSDVIPLPFLNWMDLQGNIKSMKRISKELDSIFDGWLQEHVQRRKKKESEGQTNEEEDFLDVMLSEIGDNFTTEYTSETIIKATALTIILAGSDTTSTHLAWVLSLLLNNNHVLKQAQEEIDTKIGKNRWVQESDITNLVYLQAIVKEALRLYPPGPLGVPHEAREDCEVSGFHIPKGTRLFINIWKLHRDPRIWKNPEEFRPQRFLSEHMDVESSGQQFEFIPFGSGRRSCPGIQFAQQVSHLTLARLIQGFEIVTPLGEPVDMTPGTGITLPRTTPVKVLITPRLPAEFY